MKIRSGNFFLGPFKLHRNALNDERCQKSLGTILVVTLLQIVNFDYILRILMIYNNISIHKQSRDAQHIFSCRKLLPMLENTIEVNFHSFSNWLVFWGAGSMGAAVKGRVLRTPLGHDWWSCITESRCWHGRGIPKLIKVQKVWARERFKFEVSTWQQFLRMKR